jgi:hypothetical protein
MSHDGDQVGPDTGAPLAALEGLDDLPLSDHVAAFEAAHDALRTRLEGRAGQGSVEAED